MGLTDLLQALEEEAVARTARVREHALRQVAQVRAEAEVEREARRNAALGAREAELRALAAREIEATRRTAAARRLDARVRALERIRRRVEERLAARADDVTLLPLVRDDLLRALDYAGVGPVVAVTSPGLVRVLGDALRDRPEELRMEGEPGLAGVVLRAADGYWEVDATYRSRLDRAWPRLAIELVRRLEPQP